MIEPVPSLVARVREICDLSEPDFLCKAPGLHQSLRFVSLDLDELPTGLTGQEISLQIEGINHLFTDWSRLQLLDFLGTREKWFSRVTQADQALELTRRIHTFDRQRFRRMRSYENIHFVRGLVSESYVDIPDASIIDALESILPDGDAITPYSGKSDKAFYAYVLARQAPVGLGSSAWGYPGAIIKNSEVGATALWVIPFFAIAYSNGFVAPVAIRRHALLRKIHRGQLADLRQSLSDALTKLQAVWGTLREKMDSLLTRTFATEQDAITHLEVILHAMKRPKQFIERCTTTYRAARNVAHNGLCLLTAVLTTCKTSSLDYRYDDAEVAGYLLLHLV